MNCLLLESEEVESGLDRVRVLGRRCEHARRILGLEPGDRIRIGVIGGRLGWGRVIALADEALELEVALEEEPPPKRSLCLVLALPRPPVFRRLVSTIASLGVERLLVVGTARTERSFWQSHVIRPEAIRERLLLGLEQARDTRLPEVELHRYFEPLVDEVLAPQLAHHRGLLAEPSAPQACPHAVEGPITLCVGPEGGFVAYEVERLRGIGFEAVHLGPRALRVEPVIPMLVGRLCP
jgi:RsmE family RNA methyltransferase